MVNFGVKNKLPIFFSTSDPKTNPNPNPIASSQKFNHHIISVLSKMIISVPVLVIISQEKILEYHNSEVSKPLKCAAHYYALC